MTDDKLLEQIKSKIVFYRKRKGITQNEMADRLGIARSTYAYYETRAISLTDKFLESVAAQLEISPKTLKASDSIDKDTENESDSLPVINLFEDNERETEDFMVTEKEKKMIKMFRMLPSSKSEIVFNELKMACLEYMDN